MEVKSMYTVLIVDDEPRSSEVIANYIRTYLFLDYQVCACCSSAPEALRFMNENTVHIVITDIKMPGMDGIEFISIIKKRFPLCEIILISAYDKFEYAKNAIQYNVFNYLLKPIDFSELSDNLKAIKEKLNQLYSDNTLESESIEVFFSDLFLGNIKNMHEYNNRISCINLPFDYENCNGIVLKLSSSSTEIAEKWTYSKDSIELLMKNLVALILPETTPFIITKSDLICYFAVFYPKSENLPDLTLLTKESFQLLNMSISVEILYRFDNMTELIDNDCISLQINNESEPGDNISDIQIEKALEYINENYNKDISRDDVSDAIYMSPGYFSYCFHEKTGVTFSNYLTKLRMERAISLLIINTPVNKIIPLVGYKNKNSFLLNFKKYTGKTPTEYKKAFIHGQGG